MALGCFTLQLTTLHFPSCAFEHNVESQIWERLAGTATGLKKVYFTQQWRRLQKFEADGVCSGEWCGGRFGGGCHDVAEIVWTEECAGSAVPTGVDVEYFSGVRNLTTPTLSAAGLKEEKVPVNFDASGAGHAAADRNVRTPGPRPQSLVFLGSMDWMPNIDGATFFVEEIFPLVRQKFPNVTLTIVGRNPTPAIKQMADKVPGVCVTGTVDDVRPYLGEAEVMIVPLRVGGGTRIKIFEGMATGIPVVSTRIGAEGLPVSHGQNILLADAPVEFCRPNLRSYLIMPELRDRIGGNGLKMVKEKFGWAAATQLFSDLLRRNPLQRAKE